MQRSNLKKKGGTTWRVIADPWRGSKTPTHLLSSTLLSFTRQQSHTASLTIPKNPFDLWPCTCSRVTPAWLPRGSLRLPLPLFLSFSGLTRIFYPNLINPISLIELSGMSITFGVLVALVDQQLIDDVGQAALPFAFRFGQNSSNPNEIIFNFPVNSIPVMKWHPIWPIFQHLVSAAAARWHHRPAN